MLRCLHAVPLQAWAEALPGVVTSTELSFSTQVLYGVQILCVGESGVGMRSAERRLQMTADKEKETLLLFILYRVHKKQLGKDEQSNPCHPS